MGALRSEPSAAPRASASVGTVPLITIGGPSRSGSTLLTMLLGDAPGSVAVGELRYIWSRGIRQSMLCGCGVPFRECEFWRSVLARVYGSIERTPAPELDTLQASVSEIWHLPLLLGARPAGFDRRVTRFRQHLAALCDAIRAESGAATIVDSSKLPSYCFVLAAAAGPGARTVHLVRDSRAVAFSQLRRKRKPDIHWREAYMRRFSPVQSAIDWIGLNIAMELVRMRAPVMFARYEDLVDDPLGWLRGRFPRSAFAPSLADRSVPLGTNHTVSGNPLRFASGDVTIRADTAWQVEMLPRHRQLVTAATLPLLARYGYV